MNNYKRPTALDEAANTEAMIVFAEQMTQFNASCDALRNIERNLSTTVNDVLKTAQVLSGRQIQTDDGTEWQQDVNLTNVASVCHRQTPGGLEFAVVERLPLKSKEMKEVLNRGHDAGDVLQSFIRDQRQVLRVWEEDVMAQVREHLAEKYPGQDMNIVAESFEIKMARAISETRMAAHQSQSRGMRV
jgi:hypothetical protein